MEGVGEVFYTIAMSMVQSSHQSLEPVTIRDVRRRRMARNARIVTARTVGKTPED